jgi:hypothetical protein
LLPEGDLWLGVQVEDDPEMVPRVLLDDTLYAIEAGTAYDLRVRNPIQMNGHSLVDVGGISYSLQWHQIGETANIGSAFTRLIDEYIGYQYDLRMRASVQDMEDFKLQLMVGASKEAIYYPTMNPQATPTPIPPLTGHEASVYIGGHGELWSRPPYPYQPGGLTVYANGNAHLDGSWETAAIIESNLQSTEELAANRIDRFSEGDVLCWKDGQLELCTQARDPLVQAVASENGKPIIMGAEPIKVLGPVKEGDLLVASEIPGYAMVDNDPRPGAVIAQALENFDGEQGTIKAMIRKF